MENGRHILLLHRAAIHTTPLRGGKMLFFFKNMVTISVEHGFFAFVNLDCVNLEFGDKSVSEVLSDIPLRRICEV